MSVSLSQFINTPPTAENIQALVSASQVIGLTISTTDCKLNNYQESLSQLNKITVDGLNNNNPITITSISSKPGYYYYSVTPFPIASSFSGEACLETTFSPFLEAIGFENSDFNVLFNNATSSRASTYIQDVDRNRDTTKPTNIINLLEDTALKAKVPDSYYTSFAHTSGRYVGSKTSKEDYGVESAINGTIFDGSIYLLNQNDLYICSQSYEERNINSYLFSVNPEYTGNQYFETSIGELYPSVRLSQIMSKTTSSFAFSTTDTQMTINQYVDVKAGDIIRLFNGTELMKVLNVIRPNSSTTTLTLERGYYRDHTGGSLSSWNVGAILLLIKVTGDIVYGTDSSKPYRLLDKKIWVEQTGEIFLTDKRGEIIDLSTTCN